jgi:hypothetical protein
MRPAAMFFVTALRVVEVDKRVVGERLDARRRGVLEPLLALAGSVNDRLLIDRL